MAKETLTASLVALFLLTALTSLVGVVAIRSVFAASDRVTAAEEDIVETAILRDAADRESSNGRAYLFGPDESSLPRLAETRAELGVALAKITAEGNPADRALLGHLSIARDDYDAALDRVIALKRTPMTTTDLRHAFDSEARPAMDDFSRAIYLLSEDKHQVLASAHSAAVEARGRALAEIIGVAILALATAGTLAWQLRRSTRRMELQQADLRLALDRLGQSNRDLEAFAGRVAHDVRNALAPISLASAVLCERGMPPSSLAKAGATLARAVDRARGVVDALLAFSRADGQVDMQAEAPLAAVVAAVVSELALLAEQVDANVDVAVSDAVVRCPPPLLHIILTNLVGNALKFMRDCPERRVAISTRRSRSGCELRIADSGPGIPPGDREKIFEPFYRSRHTTNVPGVGIGLATVRRIVDVYGGRIKVESNVGGGTRFLVWLPLAGAPLAESSAAESVAN